MKKAGLLIVSLILIYTHSFGFLLSESAGGIATSLGGIVLDKNLNGLNAIYNPSYISASLTNSSELVLTATSAYEPFGFSGINNASFGLTYALELDSFVIGTGLGAQLQIVSNGISERLFYLPLSVTYNNDFLPFIDDISLSINLKGINYHLDDLIDMSSISVFKNDPFGFGLDADLTVSLLENKISIGLFLLDLIRTPVSFIGDTSSFTNQMGIIPHIRFTPIPSFSMYASYNLNSSMHYYDKNNFSGAMNAFANTYIGIEGSFSTMFVRIGLNEGQLTGGLGINMDNLVIDIGVCSIPEESLYYQIDLSYKIF